MCTVEEATVAITVLLPDNGKIPLFCSKVAEKNMFLQRKLIVVQLSNFHKNSGKVAKKYIFTFCR